MANQTKGPKVEKISKGGKKEANDGKAEKRAAAKAEKEEKKAAKAEKAASAKAEKAEKKANAKAAKLQKKEASKEEKSAKKQSKSEKTKAVKIAREGDEGKKAGGKKKTLIMAAVAVALVLLIGVSVFFLLRMIRGGGEDSEASLPVMESSSTPTLEAGVAGGSQAEQPESSRTDDTEENSSEASSGETSSSENASQESSPAETASGSASSSSGETPSEGTPPPEDAKTLSEETARQAVEGTVGTASISAMLGSGAVPPEEVDINKNTPTDKPKPGQPVLETPSELSSQSQSEASSSLPEKSGGSALTMPNQTQEVPDFKFSEESLNLPKFTYAASNALEYAVHRDIGEYLAQKDERPGTQITAAVIGGQIRMPDGSLRVLAYAWGSRYAIADNTLFDYGNLVGPCAMDYQYIGGQYVLQKITLARAGDRFESSVREFCGDETAVADKMVSQAYDLELRGQMLRNVSTYIRQNNIPVMFFRASGQVYNADGTIYLPPEMQEQEAEDSAEETDSSSKTDAELKEEYKVIQDMPE